MTRHLRLWLVMPLFALGCASPAPVPESLELVLPATNAALPAPAGDALGSDKVAHGRYLVKILGCGTCHTDGALVGEPRQGRLLAGSDVGIAYTNPLDNDKPGVVFPSNLTPDIETGIGALPEQLLARLIRDGSNRFGGPKLVVMPWPAYQALTDSDAFAIAAYLRSLAPVSHRVPARVPAGKATGQEYVHFGVYRVRR